MKRRLLAVLLGLGAIGGFAAGFHSLGRCAHGHHDRRDAFERHVADVCVGAAERAKGPPAGRERVD